MAPSTPPPPSRVLFAALTMASTSSVVMSATVTSSRALPISALAKGSGGILRLAFRFGIHRAALADASKMRGKKLLRRLAPACVELLKERVIVVQPAGGIRAGQPGKGD